MVQGRDDRSGSSWSKGGKAGQVAHGPGGGMAGQVAHGPREGRQVRWLVVGRGE